MKIFQLLASPKLMYVLGGLYALILAIATFVENEHGPAVSREYIYFAAWFVGLQLLQACNLLCVFLKGNYFKRINKGSLIFHGAFLLIWLGAGVTHYTGSTGIMHIREGQNVNEMISTEGSVQERQTLPFTVKLDDFKLVRYPGSHSPKSYESTLSIKKADGTLQQATVSMNKILNVDGYRLFQSSFDTDELGTVLSVSYDCPGMQITYTGYTLLLIGFIIVLISNKSRFGRLRQELKRLNENKPLCVLFLLLMLSGGSFQHLQAQSLDSSNNHIPTVSSQHARLFGELVVLNPNGRLEPVNSYTSAILRKVHGSDEVNGINSDQFFLNLLSFPDEWGAYPFIKVDNNEIAQRFNKNNKNSKYIAWEDVFDAKGNYTLTDEINQIYAKPSSERKKLDTDLLKLDESVNIIYRIMQHQLLPLFPDENDKTGKWYSAGDEQLPFQGKDSLFVAKIMDWYIYELNKASHTHTWKEADKLVDMISIYQQAKSKAVKIDKQKVKAELLYNRLNIFSRCCPAYLIVGGLLLVIACLGMVNSTKTDAKSKGINSSTKGKHFNYSKLLGRILIVLLVLIFLMHSGGIILRWYISGHAPWTNAYESMICTSWLLVGGGLLFARQSRLLLALSALLGGIILFVAGLNNMNPEITPLVPVLQSYWLMSHVATIMIGYVFFALCALTGLINLILMNVLSATNQLKIDYHIRKLTLMNEMSMILGLFFMTAGTFLGAVWANVSWGRYWGWDPKETWALISIVVYVLVLHLRFIPLLKKYTILYFNLFSVVAVLAVIMTWFGVNFYLSGLHSYGKTDGGDLMIWYWIGGLAAILALAFFARKRLKRVDKTSEMNS